MIHYGEFLAKLGAALREFGKTEGDELPVNAITLWRFIVAGVERVADALDPPPEN